MIRAHIKMAISSLWGTKTRSILTMFGIIIGVSSVLIAVSIGQGIKNQVVTQISQLGDDVITIIPGKTFSTDPTGAITGINATANQGVSTLTQKDIESIKKVDGVTAVSQNSFIAGIATTPERQDYGQSVIIAAPADISQVLDQKLEFGEFYTAQDGSRKVVVIGSAVANELFDQRDPIGRVLTIRGQDYIVRGVLRTAPESPLAIPINYNNVIYMPLEATKGITKDVLPISQITVKVNDSSQTAEISNQIKSTLLANHNNQEDYTVVQQSDFMKATDQIFSLLTSFVAAVAGISLFVGGVGIMNIMLVSVSERTKEIGIRKAVGATNRQIVGQFLVEAIVLSVIGGIIGILLALVAAYFIKIYTPIVPSLSIPMTLIAFGVSVVVGIIFGIAPAIKAATKDPIDALRQL